MKNFFSNLLGKNKGPKSIVSFDVLNSIYAYLYQESNSIEFKMKNVHDRITVNLLTFPGSFDNYEAALKEIEESTFNDSFEILNKLYEKVEINPITQDQIDQGLEFDYIHIQFYTKPPERLKKNFKHIFHNFIIFFCSTNGAEANDFKILYTNNWFLNYVKGIVTAEAIEFTDPKNDIQEIGFEEFKTILQGICQYLDIEIPEGVELPSQENLLVQEEVTAATFEELINLVSRGDTEEKFVKKQSKKLLKNFKKRSDNYEEVIEAHWVFFESVDSWNSDWKFDPEEAEYFISGMIGHDFTFTYPKETYSHNLFPYIQSALEELNLELMTYETHGDSYLFFLANKNEVSRILELSKLTGIEVYTL
jgi:hypothetical protein